MRSSLFVSMMSRYFTPAIASPTHGGSMLTLAHITLLESTSFVGVFLLGLLLGVLITARVLAAPARRNR